MGRKASFELFRFLASRWTFPHQSYVLSHRASVDLEAFMVATDRASQASQSRPSRPMATILRGTYLFGASLINVLRMDICDGDVISMEGQEQKQER